MISLSAFPFSSYCAAQYLAPVVLALYTLAAFHRFTCLVSMQFWYQCLALFFILDALRNITHTFAVMFIVYACVIIIVNIYRK